jgi:hypothetical protein
MQRDVQQTSLTGGIKLRNTGDVTPSGARRLEQTKPAFAFRHQDPPVGKKGESPRVRQPVRELNDPEGMTLGTLDGKIGRRNTARSRNKRHDGSTDRSRE